MNEVSNYNQQLPETLEDLSKFVLVNEERIQALRAEIRAIKKVSLAKEVYEQKLAEAQEIGQITVEAAQKMGELLLQIQKDTSFHGNQHKEVTSQKVEKTKTEITSEMGMSKDQVSQYQQMAQNPEAVQAAIQKAIENGDVVSRSQVMKEIRSIKEQLAEKERKISELEKREPQIKEVVKEVIPADYERIKEDARIAQNDFKSMQKAYEEMSERWKEKSREVEKLKSEANSPEIQRVRDLKLNAAHFIRGINGFLEEFGGYTYLMKELQTLERADRERIEQSVSAIYQWSNEMLNSTVQEVV